MKLRNRDNNPKIAASASSESTKTATASLKGPKECLFPSNNAPKPAAVAAVATASSTTTTTQPTFNKERSYTVSTVETTGSDEEGDSLWNETSNTTTATTETPLTPEFHSWEAQNLKRVHEQWSLNPKQIEALQQFRNKTSHAQHWKNSPHTACQFLKENKWSVKKAVAQFERMLVWRELHQVDTILDPSSDNYFTPHPDYQYFPQAILEGLDKEGNPIYLERTGSAHLWELWERHGEIPTVQASIWTREVCTRGKWVQQYEQDQGRALVGTTAIVDLHGLNGKHASRTVLHLVKDGTQIIQENWPCEAKRVIIIRAPFLFRFVWNFLKPFLTDTVKEMIIMCTAADPLPELEQYVDLKVLPKCINPATGQGKARDEFGTVVWEGGPLPPAEEVKAKELPLLPAKSTQRKSRNGSSVKISNLGHGTF